MTWGKRPHGSAWAGHVPAVDYFPVAPGRTVGPRDAIAFELHAPARKGSGNPGELKSLDISISYPSGRREVARASGAWRPLFVGSTITIDTDRVLVSVQRTGPWPEPPTLEVDATSAEGNPLSLGYGEPPGV